MKYILLFLPLFLFGCVSQQSNIVTENQSTEESKDFITSLIILDCAYNHQGCEHGEGFATCLYHLNSQIKSFSEEQITMLRNNLRTQFGFDKNSDAEINNAADKVLDRYLQCKK